MINCKFLAQCVSVRAYVCVYAHVCVWNKITLSCPDILIIVFAFSNMSSHIHARFIFV